MVAEQGGAGADRVEGPRLADLMVGRPVKLQGLLGVAERLAVAALQFTRGGEKEVGGALAGVVAESDPASELAETEVKLEALLPVLS